MGFEYETFLDVEAYLLAGLKPHAELHCNIVTQYLLDQYIYLVLSTSQVRPRAKLSDLDACHNLCAENCDVRSSHPLL